jgi:hypothetical protein
VRESEVTGPVGSVAGEPDRHWGWLLCLLHVHWVAPARRRGCAYIDLWGVAALGTSYLDRHRVRLAAARASRIAAIAYHLQSGKPPEKSRRHHPRARLRQGLGRIFLLRGRPGNRTAVVSRPPTRSHTFLCFFVLLTDIDTPSPPVFCVSYAELE